MKPEEQRIAIHQACGYQLTKTFTGIYWKKLNETLSLSDFMRGTTTPDYLNDLNAMHEAEKARIITLDSSAFYDALQEIMGRDLQRNITGDGAGFSGWIAHATATQRAEAFLRTLNLWTE